MLKIIPSGQMSSKPMDFFSFSETVFYNKNMMIGNKVIKYTQWVDNGIYCIAHFTKEKGSFVLLRNLIHFLEYSFRTITTKFKS